MPVLQHISCPCELPYAPDTFTAIAVLAVTASEADWNRLQQLFSHSRWRLERRRTLAEARELLLSSAVPAILCDATLPDGDWKDLVEFLSHFHNPPRVIVLADRAGCCSGKCGPCAGLYDLLDRPVQATELYHAVSDAWHGWKMEAARGAS